MTQHSAHSQGPHHLSAVTLACHDMTRSVQFYRSLGFALLYGGGGKQFSSFQVGSSYLNLIEADAIASQFWGRVVFHVADVDAYYAAVVENGHHPEAPPADAPWGERYFHLRDPDGHEISFAQPL